MLSEYHRAIFDAQYAELISRAELEQWRGIEIEQDGSFVYVKVQVEEPAPYTYLIRIDMSRYPIDPYWVGFINSDLPRDRWNLTTDMDPRFWPWSPMPGLHGSFIVSFQGPFRTFWCRECNFPFFQYHGDRLWAPAKWHVERVVSYLRDALKAAEPPNRWRPLQRELLLMEAAKLQIALPPDAGLGAK